MKICIPADDKSKDTEVCISFGRTPYYLVYDSETKEITFMDNNAIASEQGAGIKAAQSIVDNNCDILITPRCGENAVDVLKAGDVKIYKTCAGSAMDNINSYLNGSLSLLSETHKGFHGHGGR